MAGFLVRVPRPRRPDELATPLYRLAGAAAVRHAFRVAASLDSMVVGEPQILGQVKEAYRAAEEAGTLGSALNALRNRSLAAAKRARTRDGHRPQRRLGLARGGRAGAQDLRRAARQERAAGRRGQDERAGGAAAGATAAREPRCSAGARSSGRTELAAAPGRARRALRDRCAPSWRAADIVISGTGAPGTRDPAARTWRPRAGARRGRPLFLIDIAVPARHRAAVAGSCAGVFLYDLDDLQRGGRGEPARAHARRRRRPRRSWSARSREFLDWQKSLDAVPLLVELRRRGDEIRRAEIEKARAAARARSRRSRRARCEAATVRDREQAAARARPCGSRSSPATATSPSRSASSGGCSACEPLIRIGTRGSALALLAGRARAGAARGARARGRCIVIITTTGDRVQDRRLEAVGGKGAFLKEIEEALLAGEVDLAVHSLKDVPTALPDGLRARGDPGARRPARRARLGAAPRLDALPAGRAGRHHQPEAPARSVRALRPDLVLEDLRGNVDTRLGKLREGRFDAILLAHGGARRGWAARSEATEALDPAPIRPRAGAGRDRARVPRGRRRRPRPPSRRSHHAPTARAVDGRARVARGARRRLQRPARARTPDAGGLRSAAAWRSWPRADGSRARCAASGAASDPGALGRALADELLARGARAACCAP